MTEKDIYRLEQELERRGYDYVDECEHLFSRRWKSRLSIKERSIKVQEDLSLPFGTILVFVPMTDSNIRVAQ